MVPVLRIPNDEDPFKLSTNASDFATEAVLSQKDMQTNLWYPVAFFFKSLDVHEKNYEIYNKELLAVIRELEKYRHHLEGHPHKIEIWSDHQNLTFFRTAQNVTNFIWSYLHQFFDDSHGLRASLKPLKRPFNRCQLRLKAINNGRDIK